MIKSRQIEENTGRNNRKLTWRGNRTSTVATWNIRGLTGKEVELVKEIKRAGVSITALTETKRKGQGLVQLEDGYTLLYSGVPIETRAKAGVAILVDEATKKLIIDWKFVNERVMTVTLKECDFNKQPTTVVAVYAPNEDDLVENKDRFYECLQNILDDSKGDIVLMGDLNGRVGNSTTGYETAIGPHGEITRNDNGKRLLRFSSINQLTVVNTKFPHKAIHKFTREEPSRDEKSIIDYIITSQHLTKKIRDARVRRGYEIGSDHYLLTAKISISKTERKRKKKTKKAMTEKIQSWKLKEEETQKKYKEKVSELIHNTDFTNMDLKETWITFRNALTEAATETCGKTKCGTHKVKTRWWTEEIKILINEKKIAWKKYLLTKNSID